MKFVLEITELDNAAFSGTDYYGPRESAIADILRDAANQIYSDGCRGMLCGLLRDVNGNKVGKFTMEN